MINRIYFNSIVPPNSATHLLALRILKGYLDYKGIGRRFRILFNLFKTDNGCEEIAQEIINQNVEVAAFSTYLWNVYMIGRICERIKQTDIDLGHWGVHADISVSQEPELLDLITANGRPYLAIGFETLSEKNADALGNRMKAALLSQYDEGVILLKSKGIEVAGSFMFGFPGDSEAELHQILAFIQRHGIRGYITRYTAIPGSQLYDEILAAYETEKGPMWEKGTAQARILNEYFMERNGFGVWETEDMIIRALKASYTSGLPLPQIDALAVFRSFFS